MMTWNSIRIITLSIICFSLFGCTTDNIILHGDIKGLVSSASTGSPIISATLVLNPSQDVFITEFDGKYLFRNIVPGNYDVTVSKSGYKTISSFIKVDPSSTEELDFQLEVAPKTEFSTKLLDFGPETAILYFTIKNIGPGNLPYLITTSKDWLTVKPSSGEATNEADTIIVTIDKSALSREIYKEAVKIISIVGSEIVKDTINVLLNGAMDLGMNYYYKVAMIGSQIWLAENLKIGTFIGSNTIPKNNNIVEVQYYANISNYFNMYGGLYQWDEMMQYKPSDNRVTGKTQGICPVGWHIPTKQEWIALIDYMGGSDVAGIGLKETGTTNWGGETGATNSSGFTALPGGCGDPTKPLNFGELMLFWGFWWSSTEVEDYISRAYRVQMSCWDNKVTVESDWGKYWAASVRCIKDK
jgi:uncharacterized protein (TIGR02145 family)